jgi:hypothetical protein
MSLQINNSIKTPVAPVLAMFKPGSLLEFGGDVFMVAGVHETMVVHPNVMEKLDKQMGVGGAVFLVRLSDGMFGVLHANQACTPVDGVLTITADTPEWAAMPDSAEVGVADAPAAPPPKEYYEEPQGPTVGDEQLPL